MSPGPTHIFQVIRASFEEPAVRIAGAAWAGVAAAGLATADIGGTVAVAVGAAIVGFAALVLCAWRWGKPHALGVAVAAVAGVVAGLAHADRIADSDSFAPAAIEVAAVVSTDPMPTESAGLAYGEQVAGGLDGSGPVDVLVSVADDTGAVARGTRLRLTLGSREAAAVPLGSTVIVAGDLRQRTGWLGRHRYQGIVLDPSVDPVAPPPLPLQIANAARSHVLGNLDRGNPAQALLAGFLVGDTSGLDGRRVEDLRRAGLTHFVAVSGSNVALVLLGWWLLAGVVRVPRTARLVGGLGVVVVFVLVTRWEPSVIRAGTVAALVLVARLIGYPLSSWRALGVAVSVILAVAPELAVDPGFQLSVAATAGVMVVAAAGQGADPGRLPAGVRTTLRAALGAQVAVLPIVLLRFGAAPLVSPIANVIAAPLVVAATALGAAGTLIGVAPLVAMAAIPAQAVLEVARHAGVFPQVDLVGAAALAGAVVSWRLRWIRPVIVAAGVAVALGGALPAAPTAGPAVIFLDVGQGDAIIILGGHGGAVLVDGGGRPDLLHDALARHGVASLDLVLATHGDKDHVGGLIGLADRVAVAGFGYPARQDVSELLASVADEMLRSGAVVGEFQSGDRVGLGGVTLDVLSPGRRYAAENDGSLVIWVAGPAATVLLTGDVGAVPQAELPSVRPDVLHVPHHGSATTDIDWLLATVGDVGVISVGPNRHGHPAPAITDALVASGVDVRSTWLEGDVVVPLG